MFELICSLTILVLMVTVYFQRKSIEELEEEVWFLERTYVNVTGNQPPKIEKQ